MAKTIVIVIILACLFGVGWFLYNRATTLLDRKVVIETERVPDMEFENFYVVESKDGKKRWELKADSARVYDHEKRTEFSKIRLTFMDEDKPAMWLTADEGMMDNSTKDIAIQGNIKAKSDDGKRLWTEKLTYNSSSGNISSDTNVKISTGKVRIVAEGIEANPDMGRIKVLGNTRLEFVSEGKEL